jgi:hypothetical protein
VLAHESKPISRTPAACPHLLETVATFDGSLATEAALVRAEQGLAGWSTPELLRVRAMRMLARAPADLMRVEKLLHRSIETAKQQRALSWELRAASSPPNSGNAKVAQATPSACSRPCKIASQKGSRRLTWCGRRRSCRRCDRRSALRLYRLPDAHIAGQKRLSSRLGDRLHT